MTNTNIIIHNLICLVNKNKGSSLLLPAYGREGQGQHSFAARQLRWHEKLRWRKSEGGVGSGSSLRQQGSKARKN